MPGSEDAGLECKAQEMALNVNEKMKAGHAIVNDTS